MNSKLRPTIVVLHISAVLYFLVAVGLIAAVLGMNFLASPGEIEAIELTIFTIAFIIAAVLCVAIGIFVEVVIKALQNKKSWAWVAAFILCILYIPSIFIVLGIIGVLGLLDKDVQKDFLKKKNKK